VKYIMAGSNDHAILDLGEDDFISTDYKNQASGSLTQFPAPDSPGSTLDTDRLIGDNDSTGSGVFNSNFWTLAFYQQFFDVDTDTVKTRLMYSMIPVPGKSFLEHHIRPKPDLYGPFWICVTLVFSIAISGNLADYLQTSLDEGASNSWHYDFHKVSLAATAVFSYAALLPSCLYGFLWWCGAGAGAVSLSFLELICLYGYSLAIYIPVSLLWLIQNPWWQWLCVLAGAGLSGAVLFIPIWPAVRHNAARSAALVMIVILGLHLVLACGFMLYFFQVAAVSSPANSNSTVAPNVVLPELSGVDSKIAEDKEQGAKDKSDGNDVPAADKEIDNSSEEKQDEKRSDNEPGEKDNSIVGGDDAEKESGGVNGDARNLKDEVPNQAQLKDSDPDSNDGQVDIQKAQNDSNSDPNKTGDGDEASDNKIVVSNQDSENDADTG
jgi:hypothetical protein